MQRIAGFSSLSRRVVPTNVPLVPSPATKCVMRPAGLLPNLVGGGVVVRLPVRGIAVLVGIEIFLGIGGDNLVNTADRAVGAFVAGSDHELRAKRGEDAFAFVRGAVGKAEFYGIAERRADHGVGDAGVAAGGVDDRFAWAERAGG